MPRNSHTVVPGARPWVGAYRTAVAVGIAALLGVLGGAPPARGIDIPDVRGDQLFFFYDAREYDDEMAEGRARTTFVNVLNPGAENVVLELATYPANLADPTTETITLGPGQNQVVDFADDLAAAGLLVVTPVVSEANHTPVVPATRLAGSFTVAGPFSGFGENAFARSVEGERSAGATVDGTSVRYEPIRPANGVLMIPTHYDPGDLNPPEEDGNRVVLIAFEDRYGGTAGFRIGPPATALDVQPIFCGEAGRLEGGTVEVAGVLVTDLQSLADDALPRSSGSVYFKVGSTSASVFGIFSQAVGHLGAGHRLVAAGQVPPCATAPPEITPSPPIITPVTPPPTARQPVCGDGLAEGDEECDGSDLRGMTCLLVVGGRSCDGNVLHCSGCKLDTSACGACSCSQDRQCRVSIDCEAVRPGCGRDVRACRMSRCVSAPPSGEDLAEICDGQDPEDRRPRCE
jgi:hypothetical protein